MNEIEFLKNTIDQLLKDIDYLQKRENLLENSVESLFEIIEKNNIITSKTFNKAIDIYNESEIRSKTTLEGE